MKLNKKTKTIFIVIALIALAYFVMNSDSVGTQATVGTGATAGLDTQGSVCSNANLGVVVSLDVPFPGAIIEAHAIERQATQSFFDEIGHIKIGPHSNCDYLRNEVTDLTPFYVNGYLAEEFGKDEAILYFEKNVLEPNKIYDITWTVYSLNYWGALFINSNEMSLLMCNTIRNNFENAKTDIYEKHIDSIYVMDCTQPPEQPYTGTCTPNGATHPCIKGNAVGLQECKSGTWTVCELAPGQTSGGFDDITQWLTDNFMIVGLGIVSLFAIFFLFRR